MQLIARDNETIVKKKRFRSDRRAEVWKPLAYKDLACVIDVNSFLIARVWIKSIAMTEEGVIEWKMLKDVAKADASLIGRQMLRTYLRICNRFIFFRLSLCGSRKISFLNEKKKITPWFKGSSNEGSSRHMVSWLLIRNYVFSLRQRRFRNNCPSSTFPTLLSILNNFTPKHAVSSSCSELKTE